METLPRVTAHNGTTDPNGPRQLGAAARSPHLSDISTGLDDLITADKCIDSEVWARSSSFGTRSPLSSSWLGSKPWRV
jgi:hypothetical protein